MHVAFVATPDLSYVSGSSLSLKYTVESLAQQGVRCTVFCQYGPGGPAVDGVTYVELPMPLDYQVITDTRPSSQELGTCLTMLVDALLRAGDVDVIHAIYGTFTGVAAVTAGSLLQVPVVVTTFGRDLTLGACVDDRYRRLMRIAYGNAALIVASDAAAADLVEQGYSGPGSQVRVVPPGMNFSMFRQSGGDLVPRSGSRRLLAVQSSFNEKKGLSLLLEALPLLDALVPGVELLVAGHDDTPGRRIESTLRAQASSLDIADRVRFLGHLDHLSVLETMRTCDVLVDPRTINSFSSCLYEAMTVGLPVVASDVPCNTEALGHGERGLLVPAGEPRALAEGIATILRNAPLATVLVEAGRRHAAQAEAVFGADRVAAQLHELYRSLMSEMLVA